jgi:transcriptional regulator
MFNPVDVGDRYVACQVRRQADTMRRKGIAENRIARELRAMEIAIDTVVRRAHGVSHDMHGGRIAY